MIYFYPTSTMSVTAQNVVDAVSACQIPPPPLEGLVIELSEAQRKERERRFKVNAFLSVPYILTILSDDLDGDGHGAGAGPKFKSGAEAGARAGTGTGAGLEMLRGMQMVSTGGAPLDTQRGDAMVQRGVKLVSRLGSSECGCEWNFPCPFASFMLDLNYQFENRQTSDRIMLIPVLLSSHRDYPNEKDWEYLRNDSAYADAIKFERVDTGGIGTEKYEMVVTKRWGSLVSYSVSSFADLVHVVLSRFYSLYAESIFVLDL